MWYSSPYHLRRVVPGLLSCKVATLANAIVPVAGSEMVKGQSLIDWIIPGAVNTFSQSGGGANSRDLVGTVNYGFSSKRHVGFRGVYLRIERCALTCHPQALLHCMGEIVAAWR
jgi:hypothetical protein